MTKLVIALAVASIAVWIHGPFDALSAVLIAIITLPYVLP